MNVLVLLGSLRPGSLNAQLATAAIEELPVGLVGLVYPHLDTLPHYSEDRDGDDAPESVIRFRAAVAAADALVLVTPEYNGSIPAVLKNAIDWASRPRGAAVIDGKPAAVLAASPSPRGAQWAREHAERVLTVAGAQPLAESFGLADAHQHFEDGVLRDQAVRAQLASLLAGLQRQPVSV